MDNQRTVRWVVWICNAAGWVKKTYVTHKAAAMKAKFTHKRFPVEGPTPEVKDEYSDLHGPSQGI